MDDDTFTNQIKAKIEARTGRAVHLEIDRQEPSRIGINLEGTPTIVLGTDVFKYPGMARMGVEYAVACIKAGRVVDELEFHSVLRRN